MKTTRRDFLQLTGKGVLLTLTFPLINSCAGIIRNELHTTSNSLGKKLPNHLKEILYYASLAPSSHNCQPWIVEVKKDNILCVKSDRKRWLNEVDPTNRETLLSIGAFIENLSIAASRLGYAIKTNYLASSLFEESIVEITLVKDIPHDISLDNLKRRRTLRKKYLSETITNEDYNFISDKLGNSASFYRKESEIGKLLTDVTLESNILQAGRENVQVELANWIRWSNSDAEKNMDGLTPASMEMSGFLSLFVRLFFDKKSVTSESFKEKGIEMVKEQLSSFGGWIVITSSDDSLPELIEAGRKFQRMGLRCREKMLALHPMSQPLEEGMRETLVRKIGCKGKLQFILRAGYVKDYPEPVSLRRPVEWFVS